MHVVDEPGSTLLINKIPCSVAYPLVPNIPSKPQDFISYFGITSLNVSHSPVPSASAVKRFWIATWYWYFTSGIRSSETSNREFGWLVKDCVFKFNFTRQARLQSQACDLSCLFANSNFEFWFFRLANDIEIENVWKSIPGYVARRHRFKFRGQMWWMSVAGIESPHFGDKKTLAQQDLSEPAILPPGPIAPKIYETLSPFDRCTSTKLGSDRLRFAAVIPGRLIFRNPKVKWKPAGFQPTKKTQQGLEINLPVEV